MHGPLNVKQISTKLGHGMFIDKLKRLMELPIIRPVGVTRTFKQSRWRKCVFYWSSTQYKNRHKSGRKNSRTKGKVALKFSV